MNELEKCMAGEWYDCHNKVFLELKQFPDSHLNACLLHNLPLYRIDNIFPDLHLSPGNTQSALYVFTIKISSLLFMTIPVPRNDMRWHHPDCMFHITSLLFNDFPR